MPVRLTTTCWYLEVPGTAACPTESPPQLCLRGIFYSRVCLHFFTFPRVWSPGLLKGHLSTCNLPNSPGPILQLRTVNIHININISSFAHRGSVIPEILSS